MKISFLIVINFALAIVSFNVNAATLHDNGTAYTHIDNLLVNGSTYTATFVDGTYGDIKNTYGDAALTYTAVQAETFANSLFNFLNPIENNLNKAFNGCTGNSPCYLSTTVSLNSLFAWSVTQSSGLIPMVILS